MSKQDRELLLTGVAFDLDFTLINWKNISNLFASIEIYSSVLNQKLIRSEYRGTRQLPIHHLESLKYELPNRVKFVDGINSALQQLRAQNICTALITDSTITAGHSQFFDCFDRIIITSRYGCSKPLSDPFYSLVAQTGIPINRWTYVGDNQLLDGNFALSSGASYLDVRCINDLSNFVDG